MKGRPGSPKDKAGPGGVTLTVRVQPRASKNGIALLDDGSCKVRLTAPPVDGAANDALVRFLAETFSVGRSDIEIIAGHTGRQKIVRIGKVDADEARRLLKETGK